MGKHRLLVIFGTRPEAIKLFPVVKALERQANLIVKTCVTAQHRGLLDQVLEVAKITPDYDLNLMSVDQSLTQLTARLLTGIGDVLDELSVDRLIVQGDTSTAMVAALAAYYRKCPVAHVEAGLRSYDIYHPWPEEVNRRMIAPIADMHFAPTQTAADSLKREGITQKVYVTGNTVIDALRETVSQIAQRPDLVSGLGDIKNRINGRRLILVTTHRRENFGQGMEQIATAIARIAERENVAVVFPVHPNPSVVSVMKKMLGSTANVILTDPLDYPCFVELLSMATIVLTDSSGVQEDAPAFGKPVLVMRETTERPEGVEAGTAKLVGTAVEQIVSAVSELLEDDEVYQSMAQAHNPFGDGKSAERIARLIAEDGL